MPRGQQDYGIYGQTSVASGISDPGEAAARLGSINVYDRRGWTVWMDDFEAPFLKWSTSIFGAGGVPALNTTYSWMGIQSVYHVITAALGDWSQIHRQFPLVRLGRIGIEFWTFLRAGASNYLRLRLVIRDGVNISTADLLLDNAARTATIVDPTGNILAASYCFPTVADPIFIPVKLVVDMDTDKYVRLMIGEQEIDLSAYGLVIGALTTDRYLNIALRLVNAGGGVGYAYLDNFILTQNEP